MAREEGKECLLLGAVWKHGFVARRD